MFVSNKIIGKKLACPVAVKRNGCGVVVPAGRVIDYNLLVDLYANKINYVAVEGDHVQRKYTCQVVFKGGKSIGGCKEYDSLSDVVADMQDVINYAQDAHNLRVAGASIFCNESGWCQEIPAHTLVKWKGQYI